MSDEKEDFNTALTSVLDNIIERSREERKKSQPWEGLFSASENGLRALLTKADLDMTRIALSTCDIIRERFEINSISDKLWDLIKAIPFAMHYVEKDIYTTEGNSCCVDKTHKVYYEAVLAEINVIKEQEKTAYYKDVIEKIKPILEE